MSKDKIVKSHDKYDSSKYFIETGIDIDRRRIMIDDEIDEYSVGIAIRGIYKMLDTDAEKPIDVYINTYGGCVYDGLALYDVLRSLEGVIVRTHALGKVMSMGTIIYLAGDERYSTARSRFMIHGISSASDGKLFQQEIDLEETKVLENIIMDILVERTKKDRQAWRRILRHEDKYYGYDEAKELGFITDDKEIK